MSALANLIARSRQEREDWRYTDVEKLLAVMKSSSPVAANEQALPSLAKDAATRQRIIFKNGIWQQNKTQFGNLSPEILKGDAASGYTLSLAAQSCLVTAPIELVFASDADNTMKLTVDLGANASATLVEHHLAEGGAAPVVESEIRLAHQAKLMHTKLLHHLHDAACFTRTNVRVDQGAYYRNFALIKNTRLLRHEINVALAGELAQCDLYGVMLLQGREHADMQLRMHHDVAHGTSRQLYKAIVKDQARGVFQGRIRVAEGAQKTDGQQLCRALLLSDQAEMDAKPELEIYADDVACSHGCAIGDLDNEAMFYLRSRGLNENEARSLLLRAFIDEVVGMLQTEESQTYVRDLVEEWMHG